MTIVLVEGESDRIAVETLAELTSVASSSIDVVSMGGATNVRSFVNAVGAGVEVLGLCDVTEAPLFHRAGITNAQCFVCVKDLEDELIRALGVDAVLEVVDSAGHLRSFRTMQKQPAQRGRPVDAQLRRFIGSHSGFKVQYARQLTRAAVERSRVPLPLVSLVRRLGGAPTV